jgi:hypothetical protein
MLNTIVNVLFGTRFSDLCYGYNAFWRYVLPVLDLPRTDLPQPADGSKLWGDGFEIETLINIRAARRYRSGVQEVPSVEAERIHGESNLHAVRDGIRVMRTIFSERFGRRPAAGLHQIPMSDSGRLVPMAPRSSRVMSETPVERAS